MNTPFQLPTSIIANGQGVNGWTNPSNILLVDGDFAVSSGSTNILEVGNFNLNIPQGSDITNFTVQVKGYRGSFNTTLQVYAVDDTSGVPLSYPMAPFQGFSGTNTLYTLPSTLFGTTWTVDQANNIKLRFIADGELHLDACLIQADYVPQIVPVPVVPSTGQVVVDEFVEAIEFDLAQSMTSSDLYMFLQSFNYPDGTPIQYADFFGEADMVIDQGVQGLEEQVVITNVEQDYQGTGLCRISFGSITNRGLKFHYPYDHDITLCRNHFGTAKAVISNSARFYSRFLKKNQIGALVSAPIYVDNQNSQLPSVATEFDFTGAVVASNDSTNPSKKIINIPGVGITPPSVVSTSSATSGASQVSSLSWSHVSSGINRLLKVEVETESANAITGITYDGVALTHAVTATNGTLRNEQWYLIAPAVGTYDIVVTMSAPSYLTCGAETYVSVNQSSPIGVTQTATGSSLSPSLVLTTGTTNSIVSDSLATGTLPIVYTVGPGQTVNWSITANPNARQGASSVELAGTSPDAVTMSWVITQSVPWALTAVEIKGLPSSLTGIVSINSDTTPAQTIVGSGGTTVSTTGGVTTISSAGGGSGITSINGDTNAAQVINAGPGISVTSSGGTTTVSNTNPAAGSVIITPGTSSPLGYNQYVELQGSTSYIGGTGIAPTAAIFGPYMIVRLTDTTTASGAEKIVWYTRNSKGGYVSGTLLSHPTHGTGAGYIGMPFTVSSDGLSLWTMEIHRNGVAPATQTLTLKQWDQSLTLLNTYTYTTVASLSDAQAVGGINAAIMVDGTTLWTTLDESASAHWTTYTIGGGTLSSPAVTNLSNTTYNSFGRKSLGNWYVNKPSAGIDKFSWSAPNFTLVSSHLNSSDLSAIGVNRSFINATPINGFSIGFEVPDSSDVGRFVDTSFVFTGGSVNNSVEYDIYPF